jgi:hypothetical protein
VVSVFVGIAVFVVVLAATLLMWRARRSRRRGWVRAGPLSADPDGTNGLSVTSVERSSGGRGGQMVTTNPLRAGRSSGVDGGKAATPAMWAGGVKSGGEEAAGLASEGFDARTITSPQAARAALSFQPISAMH